MRPKTLLLLVVAIACGLVAAFMVNQISGSGTKGDTEQVLVPKTDIPQGVKIDVKTMFVSKDFAKGTVRIDAIKEVEKLNGQVPARMLQAGVPVTDRDLNSNSNIMRELDPGYRAVTVRANVENAIAGFLLPGMRVDVLTTVRDVDNPQVTKAQIFLQNIKVLAVNNLSERPQENPNVPNPVSITLMLNPEQMERLYLVSTKASIGIGLRKPGDNKKEETKGAISPFEGDGTGEPGSGTTPPIDVAVATRNIPEGTTITNIDSYFKMVPFQKSQLMTNAMVITDPSRLQGRPFTRYLAMGQFATEANFTPLGIEVPTPKDNPTTLLIINGPRIETVDYGGQQVIKPIVPVRPEGAPDTGEPAPQPSGSGSDSES